ncbi:MULTISPECIES: hypothetical protein [Variovorax]|jgi:hypothetical protein|uniref:hypothetical protein n=1 Tax=Variovorax TaxID=34072 RepID=UPI000AA42142|nr:MULTISPECIES: hypothetical protein [Variovorax]UKI09179.1 hypothetical protein L3V85_04775 [Variovorax paradoxus]
MLQHPPALDLPPIDERLPAEWTSGAPQASEHAPKSLADWAGWLVALAVLVFFAVFGFQAMTWALAGGWQWLWMPVGLPVFAMFSVLTVVFVYTTLRERRRVRVALADIRLERGEGLRPGEPLELRLRATVPAAGKGERTTAPARLTLRLMKRGEASMPDTCCDEAVMQCESMQAARLLYMGTLCARPDKNGGTALWFVTVHDTDGEPFIVAPLRLLPPR